MWNIRIGSGLARKYQNGKVKIVQDKHSSLFFRSDVGKKKFFNVDESSIPLAFALAVETFACDKLERFA